MKHKKILILCNNLTTGGIAKSLLALAKTLHKEQVLVDVCSLQVNSDEIKNQLVRFANYIEINDLNTIANAPEGLHKIWFFAKRNILFETLMLHWGNTQKKAGTDLSKRRMYYQSKRQYKICKNSCVNIDLSRYDCVISWSELMTNYILSENVVCKKKIGWIHPDYINGAFSKQVDEKVFEKLDAIVAVSKSGQESLKNTFPHMKKKFFFVNNLIDLEEIRSLAKAYSTEMGPDSFKIVTVARLQNISKAFDRAVRIAKRLKDNGKKFVWYIVGDGENSQDIQNDIDLLGLNNYVVLLGKKDNPYPYMKEADLFVLQSYYEGRPISVDEAMIIGTPVLVTDYSSSYEQVQNGVNGFVVSNREEEIVQKLIEIIDNPEILLPMRKSLAKNPFSELTDITLFNDLITSVIQK